MIISIVPSDEVVRPDGSNASGSGIWHGTTGGGVACDVHVTRIVPRDPIDQWRLTEELQRRTSSELKAYDGSAPMLTTGQVAQVLRISQQTVLRMFDAGQLRGFRVPGSKFRRVPLTAVIDAAAKFEMEVTRSQIDKLLMKEKS